MEAVLPLRGLWRADLLEARICDALEAEGINDLSELTTWTRYELLQVPAIGPASVARLEALLDRYCLTLAPARRRRFRRPRYRLDPY